MDVKNGPRKVSYVQNTYIEICKCYLTWMSADGALYLIAGIG